MKSRKNRSKVDLGSATLNKAQVSGFTQGEEHGFNVVFARRAKMNETRTQSKNMIDLCQIKKIIAYLSKLLAGGHFENPTKIFKIFIGFSMKNFDGFFQNHQFQNGLAPSLINIFT